MMGFHSTKFFVPRATLLLVFTVNLQLVDVVNCSLVLEIVAVQLRTAVWTAAFNFWGRLQAWLAEYLPTAVHLVGIPGNQRADETGVFTRW